MIKIFEKNESSYESKVNFVDSNDVFVGYDMEQECCEDADWFIADNTLVREFEGRGRVFDLSSYVFDKLFFETVIDESWLEDGEAVMFKMESESKPDLFLYLYNSHNGYYSHGFEVKHKGLLVKEGLL